MSYEEDEFSKFYEYSECVRNTEECEIDGKNQTVLLPSFGLLKPLLCTMESMAREIEFDRNSAGFVIKTEKWGNTVVVAKPFGERYFYSLKAFHQNYAFRERYVYSPHVSAICEAFEVLGLHPNTFRFRDPGARDTGTSKTHGEVFNNVVATVAEILGSSKFKERLRARQRKATRNEATALAFEQKVFEAKSRQLVLMLHFGYKEQYRAAIKPELIQQHREKFFNNCRTNKLLAGILDYIWKMEEGEESGLHLHVLIFYTAASCRDVRIAQQLGEYWVKVTGGMGQYWNSNAHKAFHEKYGHGIGTGEIDWNDDPKREALRKNILYMTKADQFLTLKYGERCHLFGTSQIKEKKKPGRPRNVRAVFDGDPAGSVQADAMDPGADQNE